jgi:hypothetical protein
LERSGGPAEHIESSLENSIVVAEHSVDVAEHMEYCAEYVVIRAEHIVQTTESPSDAPIVR